MNLSIWKKIIRRCLLTGLIGVILVLCFWQISLEPYQTGTISFGFSLGFLIGFTELYILRRFKVRNFFLLIALRAIMYGLVIMLLFYVMALVLAGEGIEVLVDRAAQREFRAVILQCVFIALLISFYLQVETFIGVKTFPQYLRGKYIKPREEERFFMFIDLNNSTKIAEDLGNKEYYSFLNLVFRCMSPAIFKSEAEIYKYIGDEVILTWTVKNGKKNNNAVNVPFEFQKELHKNRQRFKNNFNTIPRFKASLHLGTAIVSQLGDLKKEIAYNGDVINTTARIIDQCKHLNAPFLISEEAILELDNIKDISLKLLPNIKVVGKKEGLNLYGVEKLKNI